MALGLSTTEVPRYFKTLCAFMEPMAIETMKAGPFSYTIPSDKTKYMVASFFTKIGSTGRTEVRDLRKPLALRGVTLNGNVVNKSAAVIIDPELPVYEDPIGTYYERMAALDELPTRTIDFTGALQDKPFLAGPHGAFIINVSFVDMCWIAAFCNTGGWNLYNEIDDAKTWRTGYSLAAPVSKLVINRLISGNAIQQSTEQPPMGTITYVILPASWSKVPDNNTYAFRDDFMAPTLDTTTKWNRIQSTTGNMEIDTQHQWLKCTGNLAWNSNTIVGQTSFSRSTGKKFEVDVFINLILTGAKPRACVGWGDGAGNDYTNFVHGFNFANTFITILENGNVLNTTYTYTPGMTYRVRVTPNTASGAVYEIQGGSEYGALGGTSWTNITPTGSSASTSTLYPMISAFDKTIWASDVKVY